jgi:alkylation response protein AidB-like acyl-CoA dehydrogenase
MTTAALDAETLTELLQTIRRFVTERLIPAEEKVDREDQMPADILEEMKAMGLYGRDRLRERVNQRDPRHPSGRRGGSAGPPGLR